VAAGFIIAAAFLALFIGVERRMRLRCRGLTCSGTGGLRGGLAGEKAAAPAPGDAFDDMPLGALPAHTGKAMRFTGTTVLKVENGLIAEEIGLDDGVTCRATTFSKGCFIQLPFLIRQTFRTRRA
jgi:hypothetical protein